MTNKLSPDEESAAARDVERLVADETHNESAIKYAVELLDTVSPARSVELHSAVQAALRNVTGSLDRIRLVQSQVITDTLARIALNSQASTRMISEQILRSVRPDPTILARAMAGWTPRLMAISNPRIYALGSLPRDSYSSALKSPGSYFEPHEGVIDSFQDLSAAVVLLISKVEPLQLVWRGQQDADWAMQSSLFRRLLEVNGVKKPGTRVHGPQPFPTEDQMVAAEREILRVARREWRLDGLPALETFARIQHAGGSTRLIDVTRNPFIGAWCACESHPEMDDHDGRLFAFATTPPLGEDVADMRARVTMDDEWSGYLPLWHGWEDVSARREQDWGTGSVRRLWVPPTYDSRIAAQNAAFLIDGVPLPVKSNSYFPNGQGGYWTRADRLAAGSIYMKTTLPTRKPRANQYNLAPTFTFRITSKGKKDIRRILTDQFGYTVSSIYPDVSKLAEYIRVMDLPPLES